MADVDSVEQGLANVEAALARVPEGALTDDESTVMVILAMADGHPPELVEDGYRRLAVEWGYEPGSRKARRRIQRALDGLERKGIASRVGADS